MTSPVTTIRKWRCSGVFIIALSVVGLVFQLFFQTPLISASPQNTCIGIGGWPCGYTGPFTGEYYAGYATLGCIPADPDSTCVVPQIAVQESYLVIGNAPYVIDWVNETFQSNRLADGSTISVSGKLDPIFYNKTAGSTYMIYRSNAKGLWNPQPHIQIQNASLTAQPVALTTTLSFMASGSSNGVWNTPMIPTGTYYAVSDSAQQHAINNLDIPSGVMILAIAVGVGAILAGMLAFSRKRSSASVLLI